MWTASTESIAFLAKIHLLTSSSSASFFDTTTDQCDNVTFALLKLNNNLTKQRRQGMTDLVHMLNKQIAAAVERAGDKFIFVDWNVDMAKCGGRMCEAGIVEPAPTREGLMFFEPHLLSGWIDTVGGQNNTTYQNKLRKSKSTIRRFFGRIMNWIDKLVSRKKKQHKEKHHPIDYAAKDIIDNYNVTGILASRVLPIKLTRPFHPKSAGHAVIARNILSAMHNEVAKSLNLSAPVPFDACRLEENEIVDWAAKDTDGEVLAHNFNGEVVIRQLFDFQLDSGKFPYVQDLILSIFGSERYEEGKLGVTDLIVAGIMGDKDKKGKMPSFDTVINRLFGQRIRKGEISGLLRKILGTVRTDNLVFDTLIDHILSHAPHWVTHSGVGFVRVVTIVFKLWIVIGFFHE